MKIRIATVFAFAVIALTSHAQQLADFHLTNLNSNSVRPSAIISPRDYLLQVSGFYFGNAG